METSLELELHGRIYVEQIKEIKLRTIILLCVMWLLLVGGR